MRLKGRKAMLGRGGIEERLRYIYIVNLFGAVGESWVSMYLCIYAYM